MKGLDIFCSSPASTAVRSSLERNHGRRSFDQSQNPKFYVPCISSRMPIIPLPYQKPRRSSGDQSRRKSCADADDLRRTSPGSSSSRYLLRDKPFLEDNWVCKDKKERFLGSDRVKDKEEAVNVQTKHVISSNCVHSPVFEPPSSVRSSGQVVVLRVSIYCKGCEGKVRKHLSKMEGVASFSIDLEQKKVTVVGHVTPLGVLNSISKVKNAQFWPSPAAPSAPHSNYR